MTTASPEDVFKFLSRAHDEFQPLSEKITFDKTHRLHFAVIALYGSIIELTGSIIVLLNKRMASGVPILLRAILEAYVDLVNLLRNKQYGYHLEASYRKEFLKVLEEAKRGKNEYLAGIAEKPDLDEIISKWRKEQKKLESKGYSALKQFDKFKRADMEKEYSSIYNLLCSDAHNNLRSLIKRHAEWGAQDFLVVVYKAYSPEDSATHIGINAEILVRATQQVHDFFDSPVKSEIAKYRSEIDSLRGDSAVA